MSAYSASIACIPRRDTTLAGTGIVVDERRVLTCAHVINEALDRSRFESEPPADAVIMVRGPYRREGELPFEMEVVPRLWRAPAELLAYGEPENIAVLVLRDGATFPADVATVRLIELDLRDEHDRQVWLTGFLGRGPSHRIGGLIHRINSQERIQVDPATGRRVVVGFSGAGSWDDRSGGIVGMLVTRRKRSDVTIAYGLPINVIAKHANLALTPLGQERVPIATQAELLRDVTGKTAYAENTAEDRKQLPKHSGDLLVAAGEMEHGAAKIIEERLEHASRPLLDWPQSLPGGTWIGRPELGHLLCFVEEAEKSTTAVLGSPGSGKSGLLATFGKRLTEPTIPLRAIKADFLDRSIQSEEDLRIYLGLDATPGELLLQIAQLRPLVLLIDQLDALAGYVDLRTGRLSVLLNLVRKLGSVRNVHIVLSADTFEYEHDVRLKVVKAQSLLGVHHGSRSLPDYSEAGRNHRKHSRQFFLTGGKGLSLVSVCRSVLIGG